jgi:UDP-glucose 4-epimerase
MKIWITGIAGFLGSHLADALIAEGHDVGGNDNLLCGDWDNYVATGLAEYALVEGEQTIIHSWKTSHHGLDIDCCNFDDMKSALDNFQPEILVHCAATAHEGLSSFSPSFITKNIYEASVATFSAAIASGVKRIVYMSSMSRYGDNPPPFHEYDNPKPVDPYAVAKVAAEQTLKILCETHGVDWSIAVPHNIIGPRQRYVDPYRNVASIMINRCKQGKRPIVYGNGSQVRCFSPIEDVIPSIVKMVHGEGNKEVINIGPDHGEITILELANKVIQFTGFNGSPQFMQDRPNEVKHAYCSSEKAKSILGYKPVKALDECLKDMVKSIEPKPFVYDFPLEIITERTPKTWVERLI